MNLTLVKSIPEGDYSEVSALFIGWKTEMRLLAVRKLPIRFDMYPKTEIPEELQTILNQHGYHDYVLENDRWQHFLVSISDSSNCDQRV